MCAGKYHHCPTCSAEGKGSAAKSNAGGYCQKHQVLCSNGHEEQAHSKKQKCFACVTATQSQEASKKKAAAIQDKKAKKEAEKKSMNQPAPKDRKPRSTNHNKKDDDRDGVPQLVSSRHY